MDMFQKFTTMWASLFYFFGIRIFEQNESVICIISAGFCIHFFFCPHYHQFWFSISSSWERKLFHLSVLVGQVIGYHWEHWSSTAESLVKPSECGYFYQNGDLGTANLFAMLSAQYICEIRNQGKISMKNGDRIFYHFLNNYFSYKHAY